MSIVQATEVKADLSIDDSNTNIMMSLLKQICFPYTLMNLLIATSLFFIYTAIAFSKDAFSAYTAFLIIFSLYLLILVILLMKNTILAHTMFLSIILFMGFYNFLPLFFVKNISPNNYVILLTTFFIVASLFIYFYGYNKVIENTMSNSTMSALGSLLMTFFLCLIGAGVAVTIILFCFGSSYLPNYIINSNVDICSRPTSQSFKCKTYKDGKLVS